VSFWKGKKTLVTGSEGLIGTPLCNALVQLGADVVHFDRALSINPLSGHLHDVLDRSSLQWVSQQARDHWGSEIEFVFHLAANSGVEESRDAGYDAFMLNIVGTLNVLEAYRDTNVKAVVIASSNHVYGNQRDAEDARTLESSSLNQLDAYSAGKICADYLARAYAHNYDVPTVILRNTNCYGPDDPHFDHIIPGTVRAILDGETPVIKSTGLRKKSYLYVDDVVRGYLSAAEWTATTGNKGEVFNLADAEPISALDLVRKIMTIMGSEEDYVILNGLTDQSDEWLCSDKARVLLGWSPLLTLDEGLQRTIGSMREEVRV